MDWLNAGRLDKRIMIQAPLTAQDEFGAAVITWSVLAIVSASVVDMLPSKSESVLNNIVADARNTSRFRIRYLAGFDSSMRVIHDGAVYNIIAGPAIIGRKEVHEFVGERYSL